MNERSHYKTLEYLIIISAIVISLIQEYLYKGSLWLNEGNAWIIEAFVILLALSLLAVAIAMLVKHNLKINWRSEIPLICAMVLLFIVILRDIVWLFMFASIKQALLSAVLGQQAYIP